ncbi:RidA family protein [Variovorax paradoxus]|jgi:enamine deaminase RidA (YjgF/YER057c/UK114 family)|uniref:RidA family protein n=1 Tax=Variovorax paradoxus TaxID=34073 RepID=UPI000A592DDF|nr:RidA family protein [Variovorax paradoxus]
MSFTQEVVARLAQRGHRLPTDLPMPLGHYVPFRLRDGLGFLAGQVPGYGPGSLPGRVGQELSFDQGRTAAVMAALNALGRLHEALGGFDRLEGLLHVSGHVASSDGFWDQAEVLDGASELFTFALGERGVHTRAAFAAQRLPKNLSIELEISFGYRDRVVGAG